TNRCQAGANRGAAIFRGADDGRNSKDTGSLDQDCKPGLAGRPGVAARGDRGAAMTPGEWERVKQIFDLALAEPVADRAGFLQSQCGEDSHIRSEVERLLAEHERASGFLEPPSEGSRFALSGSEISGMEAPLTG